MSSNGDSSPVDDSFKGLTNTTQTVLVISSVVIILIMGIVVVVVVYVCKNRRKIGKEIVDLRRNAASPPPSSNSIPIWEADAPTMDRFFKELAQDKPVRFTPQQLYTFTTNYAKILGSGGYGKVYEGKFPNGVKIAVKVLNKSTNDVSQQFMAEVGSIGRVHHINLVRLFGFCHDQFMSALVYEFMENGSLDRHLFGENQLLEWEKLHDIALGTAKGIAYLHEECHKRIIHYDIKPENVLLDASFSPKVADFGLAKLCNRDDTHVSLTGYRGTPGYSAPEFMLKNYPITYKCDVYSFGMLMFEIVGRRRNTEREGNSGDSLDWFPEQVWTEYEKGELIALVESRGIPENERSKAERMCMVALWCVQDQPQTRPPMSVVVKMLEGDVEILQPPKPFSYWFKSTVMGNSLTRTTSKSSTSQGMDSCWIKEKATTPVMNKYEITIATH